MKKFLRVISIIIMVWTVMDTVSIIIMTKFFNKTQIEKLIERMIETLIAYEVTILNKIK